MLDRLARGFGRYKRCPPAVRDGLALLLGLETVGGGAGAVPAAVQDVGGAGAVFVVDLKMQAVADEQRTLGQRGGVVLDCRAVPSGEELKLAAVTRIGRPLSRQILRVGAAIDDFPGDRRAGVTA